jgi:hypothetical protein
MPKSSTPLRKGVERKSGGVSMSTDRIGQAAGAIWKKLHEKGGTGTAFADVKKLTGFTQDEILAGIGWLAREGKLSFKEGAQRRVIISLVEEQVYA